MLHIINKSPLLNAALDSCLRVATGGDLLLIEDAVYAATRGYMVEDKIKAAMSTFNVHVLQPDLEARGVADKVIEGINRVDYEGFVDLVANNDNCQSWL